MPYDFSEEVEMTNKELSGDINKLSPLKKKAVKKVKRYPKGSKTPYEGQEILEKQISDTESLLHGEADPIDIINRVVETLEKEQDKEYSRENRKALNSLNDAVKHLTRKQNKKG